MTEDYRNYLISLDKSSYSIKQYLWSLGVFLKWLEKDNTELENVSPKEMMAYLHHMQKRELSPNSRSVHLSMLNTFFDYQMDRGLRDMHPSRHLKVRGIQHNRLHQIFTIQELEALYNNYGNIPKTSPNDNQNWYRMYKLGRQRNKAILGCLIAQGLITAEVKRIELSDMDLKAGKVFIRGSRTSNERTLDLKPWQVFDLMHYQFELRPQILRYYDQPTDDFFLSIPFNDVSKVTVNNLRVWDRLKLDLQKLQPRFTTMQQIRASVIVDWLKHYNLRKVQYMAGHMSVGSTEKFLTYHTDDLKIDVDKFHPLG